MPWSWGWRSALAGDLQFCLGLLCRFAHSGTDSDGCWLCCACTPDLRVIFFATNCQTTAIFSFGPELAPLKPALTIAGMQAGGLLQERTFIGNAEIGYKVAICQRDVAIYGSIFLAGALYALIRAIGLRRSVSSGMRSS